MENNIGGVGKTYRFPPLRFFMTGSAIFKWKLIPYNK